LYPEDKDGTVFKSMVRMSCDNLLVSAAGETRVYRLPRSVTPRAPMRSDLRNSTVTSGKLAKNHCVRPSGEVGLSRRGGGGGRTGGARGGGEITAPPPGAGGTQALLVCGWCCSLTGRWAPAALGGVRQLSIVATGPRAPHSADRSPLCLRRRSSANRHSTSSA